MKYTIHNNDLSTQITVDETSSKNTLITIKDGKRVVTHYLTPTDLRDFIQLLNFVSERKNTNVIDNAIRSEMRSGLSLSSVKAKRNV